MNKKEYILIGVFVFLFAGVVYEIVGLMPLFNSFIKLSHCCHFFKFEFVISTTFLVFIVGFFLISLPISQWTYREFIKEQKGFIYFINIVLFISALFLWEIGNAKVSTAELELLEKSKLIKIKNDKTVTYREIAKIVKNK